MTTPNASSVPPASVQEGASVLGSLVSGLTDGDVRRLDQFEGSQYEKCQVRVCMLRSIASSSQEERLKDTLNAQTHVAEEGEEIEATAYVWISGREWLEDAEWDFETFKRSGAIKAMTSTEAIEYIRGRQQLAPIEAFCMQVPSGIPLKSYAKYVETFAKQVLPAFR